jgi:hypothetical protein
MEYASGRNPNWLGFLLSGLAGAGSGGFAYRFERALAPNLTTGPLTVTYRPGIGWGTKGLANLPPIGPVDVAREIVRGSPVSFAADMISNLPDLFQ